MAKKIIKLFILVVIIQGCIVKTRVNKEKGPSDYIIDSTSTVSVAVDSCCIEMYHSFLKSKNYLDLFYYNFKPKNKHYLNVRIIKEFSDSKIKIYKSIDNKMIEEKSLNNIEEALSRFFNQGNFLIINQSDILSNDIDALYVKTKGELTFTLINYTSSIILKESDKEKFANGIELIHLINTSK
ncbi:hypothetical protein [Emticicia sp. 17c]|uniref:hypothetical protein n=1 Tax=Emticicia sp. 17c TaxID=3127704 RepID=UPI00301D9FDC